MLHMNIKEKQFEIIRRVNPMRDDYHVGIRTVDDIKTYQECLDTSPTQDEEIGQFVYPDWTKEQAEYAFKTGEITVYSSYVIKPGVFVTPSKIMASEYAENGKIYSVTVPIEGEEVAWINGDEGIYVGKINSQIKSFGEFIEED